MGEKVGSETVANYVELLVYESCCDGLKYKNKNV